MFAFLLVLIVFVLISFGFSHVDGYYDVTHFCLGALGALFAFCIFSFIECGYQSAFYNAPESEKIKTPVISRELICLKDNTSNVIYVRRNYAHTGKVLKYYFIYNKPGYGMTQGNLPADNVYLQYTEDENETPTVTQWAVTSNWPIAGKIFNLSQHYYVMRVPEGSIIEDTYEIDME